MRLDIRVKVNEKWYKPIYLSPTIEDNCARCDLGDSCIGKNSDMATRIHTLCAMFGDCFKGIKEEADQ